MAYYFINHHDTNGVYAAVILAWHCWPVYAVSANDGDCSAHSILADGIDLCSCPWWLDW